MQEQKSISLFSHLHVHSSYSIGEGLSSPSEICALAHLSGFKSLALTDTNNTFGFMEFHREAIKLGIKPIYGAYILHGALSSGGSGRFPLGLIAVSREGLKNLSFLCSISYARAAKEEGVHIEELEKHSNGLLVLAGASNSEVAQAILSGRTEEAGKIVESLRSAFLDRVFLEIQPAAREGRLLSKELNDLATSMNVEPLLTFDVRYAGHEKREVYDLLDGLPVREPGSDFFATGEDTIENGLKPIGEVEAYYEPFKRAYENTSLVEELVPGDLLNDFDNPSKLARTAEEALKHRETQRMLEEKVRRRFLLYFYKVGGRERRHMKRILQSELDVINNERLAKTFLLFNDIITALRKDKIRMGPATGLTLQSLCAYLLNITSFNPYEDGPEFLPILDGNPRQGGILEIQMAMEDREKAVRAIRSVFGSDHMAYVPSIERMTAVRALKAAAKKVEVEDGELEKVLKAAINNQGTSLRNLFEKDEELGTLFKRSSRVREMVRKAVMLEGLPTGFIKSRRTIAASEFHLRDFLGVISTETPGDLFIHATKDSFPTMGTYRIDLTPLGSLSVCKKTERELRKRRIRTKDWDELPKNDEKVWKQIQGGESVGVYIMESSNLKKQCIDFSPQSMDDLTDFLALMRVPSDEKTFAERIEEYKSFSLPESEYKPELMAVIGKIRGTILYKEQLRDIIHVLTGLSICEACHMLEKFKSEDPGELSMLRKEFMRCAADEEIPMEEAGRWFEKLLYYAKGAISHQRIHADSLLVYKMFYLKTYYQSQFFLSLLNTYWDNEAKLKMYLAYLHDLGLLLPVDINRSELYFTLEGERIRLGINMIEGVSYPAILQILNARSRKRKFKSLEDFIKRIKGRGVSIEAVAKLIVAGAFDFTGISRTNMINALPELFEDPVNVSTKTLKDQLELPFVKKPRISREGDSGDLIEKILSEKAGDSEAQKLHDFRVLSALDELYSERIGTLVEIAGRISNIQRLRTSSGKMIGFFVLFDFSAFVHVFVPWDRFSQFNSEIEDGKRVVVRGRVTMRDEKKICHANDLKAFSGGESSDEKNGPDEPAKRNP